MKPCIWCTLKDEVSGSITLVRLIGSGQAPQTYHSLINSITRTCHSAPLGLQAEISSIWPGPCNLPFSYEILYSSTPFWDYWTPGLDFFNLSRLLNPVIFSLNLLLRLNILSLLTFRPRFLQSLLAGRASPVPLLRSEPNYWENQKKLKKLKPVYIT